MSFVDTIADEITPDFGEGSGQNLGNTFDLNNGFGDDLDPFKAEKNLDKEFSLEIHITIRKRNARKMTTTVTGLGAKKFDLKEIAKVIKKKQCCNGTADLEKGKLVFSGDQRQVVSEYLQKNYEVSKKQIVIHGF